MIRRDYSTHGSSFIVVVQPFVHHQSKSNSNLLWAAVKIYSQTHETRRLWMAMGCNAWAADMDWTQCRHQIKSSQLSVQRVQTSWVKWWPNHLSVSTTDLIPRTRNHHRPPHPPNACSTNGTNNNKNIPWLPLYTGSLVPLQHLAACRSKRWWWRLRILHNLYSTLWCARRRRSLV